MIDCKEANRRNNKKGNRDSICKDANNSRTPSVAGIVLVRDISNSRSISKGETPATSDPLQSR